MVRLTDRPDMTLDVYRGRKITMQQQQKSLLDIVALLLDQSLYKCVFYHINVSVFRLRIMIFFCSLLCW